MRCLVKNIIRTYFGEATNSGVKVLLLSSLKIWIISTLDSLHGSKKDLGMMDECLAMAPVC
jgi:hypothetical protein